MRYAKAGRFNFTAVRKLEFSHSSAAKATEEKGGAKILRFLRKTGKCLQYKNFQKFTKKLGNGFSI